MGHSSISQPFTASQARLIGRCSVGGRLYRPPFPARQPTPIAPTPWRLYRPPFPVGNRTALAPTRSRFIRCHAVHTLLRHPAVPITNSITAALPQARLIGRCSVGGRLYRPPFRGSRPISTAPIYRQLHHPLFPTRRPAPIVPTSWRLYRAPVPILRQFAVVLSQARLIGRCSVGGRLYRPPLPVGNRTALAPTRSRFIRCHAAHTLLRHPAVPITNSITAALPQARLIGRCSVGGRLYRPPFPACQPTPISPTHRQLDPPLFPVGRPNTRSAR